MKSLKYLFIASLVALATLSAKAQYSTTVRVALGGFTNLHVGPAEVHSFTLSTTTTNAPAYLQFWDTPKVDTGNLTLRYTNAQYSVLTNFGTNVTISWTNFYGRSNGITSQKVLWTGTNTVAAGTNFYPFVLQMNASPTASATISGVEYLFNNGVGVTNIGAAPVDITINYSAPPSN